MKSPRFLALGAAMSVAATPVLRHKASATSPAAAPSVKTADNVPSVAKFLRNFNWKDETETTAEVESVDGGGVDGIHGHDHHHTSSVVQEVQVDLAEKNDKSSLSLFGMERGRKLQTNNCLDDIYSGGAGTAGCTASNVKFEAITDITVHDPEAYFDAETELWMDACRGSDDNVNISFLADVTFMNTKHDIGLYIAMDGGNAYTGDCSMAGMTTGVYGTVTISENNVPADNCPDSTGSGTINLPFGPVILACVDQSGGADGGGDGKLDFGTAVVWTDQDEFVCDVDDQAKWPTMKQSSKCWGGNDESRMTIDVYVPPHITPTSQPSESPSLVPSGAPTISSQPSSVPSSTPSDPPTKLPSQSPTISAMPSDSPSRTPSQYPSGVPTREPSSEPSKSPSAEPSLKPSSSPSISAEPTDKPSASPSVSSMPSISAHPSTATEYPSVAPSGAPSSVPTIAPTAKPSSSPSISAEPTPAPTGAPSISSMPSSSPTVAPSAEPSASPTDGFYYPDWTNEDQVCTNDGHDPEYMLEIQRVNYLYRSKEDCCRNHFWWRITQCMANEHPMYYSTGSACDVKVEFEDWESKYTPGSWDASGLYETLEECCIAEFWFNIDGCLGDSPRETTFDFSFDVYQLLEPGNCQDADIIANAIGVGINNVLGGTSHAEVQAIGCATLSRNFDTGNPECGGCLGGTSFLGDYDGRGVDLTGAELATTTVSGIISTTSNSCADAACFNELLDSVITKFSASVADGSLTDAIVAWSYTREPPVLQLQATSIVTTSFDHEVGTNPFSVTAGSTSGLEVTVGGSFDVNFDFSVVTTVAELELLATFFTNAITSSLDAGGDLPSGTSIGLTSICGIDLATATDPIQCSSTNTAIEYSSTMYLSHDADAVGVTTLMSDVLSNPSTVQSITSAVIADASTGVSVPLTEVTTSGSLAVTFDTSSFTVEDSEEATAYFEDAILENLVDQGLIPPGSSVVVTSISGGIVQYDLITHVDENTVISDMTNAIQSSLSSSTTQTAITTSVVTASTQSTSTSTTLSTATQSLAISSSTVGTATEADVFKVTTSGEFTVSSFDSSSLTTAAQIKEASSYFEDAITEQLEAAGLLSTGSTVTVTGILNGVVQYDIALYSSSTSTSVTTVSAISNLFGGSSSSATLSAISSSVATAASTSTSDAISTTLSSVSISSFTEGDTTGVPVSGAVASDLVVALQSMSIDSFTPAVAEITSLAKYYPDWNNAKTCVNDGREPPFIKEIGAGYLFDTAAECCLTWFSFDDTCGQSASQLNAPKIYPDFSTGYCAQAPLSEIENKLYIYDSLTECCVSRFPLALDKCCDSPDLGGCTGTGNFKFVPDYINQKCFSKDETFVEGWELKLSRDSLQDCCNSAFPWNPSKCCENSGGC